MRPNEVGGVRLSACAWLAMPPNGLTVADVSHEYVPNVLHNQIDGHCRTQRDNNKPSLVHDTNHHVVYTKEYATAD